MTFRQTIDQVASSTDSGGNILADGQFTCTYQEVPNTAESIDQHLADRGIGAQDCLAFECVNTVPGALTLLCLLRNGYSFVLLPPLHSSAEKPGIRPPQPRFCRYEVTIDSASGDGSALHYSQPGTFLRIEENEQYDPGKRAVASSGGPRLYLRTSGSLGSPKMAVHSHTHLLGNVLNSVERFGLEWDDRIAIPVPIFHSYGLTAAFLPGVVVGASIDLQERSNILIYLERERRFNPNVAFLTPALCDMLVKRRRAARPYRLVVTAGDRIRKETFLAFESRFGRLVNLYGSTETGAMAAADPDDPLDVRAVTVGKPMSDVQMRLKETDPESDDEMEVSELCCKHEYGFSGYVDENGDWIGQGASTKSDWFETGDLGRIWQNGYIEVLGRRDHSVNRAGRLVSFADIERAMETIEEIERVVVVASGEGKWGKRIVAFCVLGAGQAALDSAEVRQACFDVLPRYAIPDDMSIVGSLPTLPNGKVDRRALAKMASKNTESSTL
jgi:acyl-CoA synthetase (AMP-forming)/AMP-acid ligase II